MIIEGCCLTCRPFFARQISAGMQIRLHHVVMLIFPKLIIPYLYSRYFVVRTNNHSLIVPAFPRNRVFPGDIKNNTYLCFYQVL